MYELQLYMILRNLNILSQGHMYLYKLIHKYIWDGSLLACLNGPSSEDLYGHSRQTDVAPLHYFNLLTCDPWPNSNWWLISDYYPTQFRPI